MTTNNPQSTNDELERKLNEIKTQLRNMAKEAKKQSYTNVAAFAGSYVLAGLVLINTADTYSKPFWFGWGLAGIGIVVFVNYYYKWKLLDRQQ